VLGCRATGGHSPRWAALPEIIIINNIIINNIIICNKYICTKFGMNLMIFEVSPCPSIAPK
jgi:hypothetical protein